MVAFLICGLAAMLASCQQSPAGGNRELTPIGFVADVQGAWTRTNDGKLLQVPDAIFPSTSVKTESSTKNAITIALFDGRTWSKRCTEQAPCNGQSLPVPSPPVEQRGFWTFLSTYLSEGKRLPVIFTASRSASPAEGPEACVLEIQSGVADLSACLAGNRERTLTVKLTSAETTSDVVMTQSIDWPKEKSVLVNPIPSGVYGLALEDVSGYPVGVPTAALVVNNDAPAARAMTQELEAAKKVAAQWTGVDRNTVRDFLVRVIYSLDALRSARQ